MVYWFTILLQKYLFLINYHSMKRTITALLLTFLLSIGYSFASFQIMTNSTQGDYI